MPDPTQPPTSPTTPTTPTAPTLLQLVLIQPSVYVRVFDLDHQAEQFEVFHKSALTRWAHYAGTEAIVFAFFVAAWSWNDAAAALLGAALVGWYLTMNRVVGGVAGVVVAVLAVAAQQAQARFGLTAAHAGVALLALAAIQNVSHAVEPVPPTLTGRGFERFPVFWARATTHERLRVLALNAAYLPLELVSAPRLFAVHVLRALQRCGWRRDWRDDVVRRADRILRQ